MSKSGLLLCAFVVLCAFVQEGTHLKQLSNEICVFKLISRFIQLFFDLNNNSKWLLIISGQSLRCFQCNSLFSNGCGESINTYNHIVQSVIDCNAFSNPYARDRQQCRKITYRLPAGGWGYIRGCNQNDNPDFGLLDPEVYVCDTDACNSASLSGPIWVMAIVTSMAVILSRIL